MAEGHDTDLEYTIDDLDVLEGFDVTVSADGRRYTVSGKCPQCGGKTDYTVSRGTPEIAKGLGWRRDAPALPQVGLSEVPVNCCCGYPHAHRPDNEYFPGCGARWKVRLP
ncbi:hypothetical protein [Actinomadura rupiterrae]|uniref:hypothetical protein n=1 Tax=Actinomadura rupiterrae TaxID=559627 RepID=UPI0020A2485F|nr:hypothetical protein [Actinomadura rupiterrae]MCP2336787.1 hypothetical protein [Actinomadura rupiterrae]